MAMAGVAGFQVVIHKKQLFSTAWKLDVQERLWGRGGKCDGNVHYSRQLGPRAASSAIKAGAEGSNGSKKAASKKGSSKAGRGEPVMAFRDQVAVCALASATLDRAAVSSPPRGSIVLDEGARVAAPGRELSPAGDAATSLERSRLESQWSLFLSDAVDRPLPNLEGMGEDFGEEVVDVQEEDSANGLSDGLKAVKVISSGRPSARLRRLEARQRRLSGVEKPSPMEAFMIHPLRKTESSSKADKAKKPEGVQDYLSTYLRDITKIDRLTAEEEIMLSKKIRTGYILKEERKKFERALGHPITKDQWAGHMHMAVGDLDAQLHEAELARDRMVMANLRLVVSVVKQYNCEGLEVPDLIQEGSIGLLKGVEKFDHTRGYKLSTYVHWWIRQGVTRAIADHSRTVRLPVHVHDTLGRIRRTRARMLQDGAPATVQTLSKALNLSDNQVKNALKVPKKLKSLDMQVGHQKSVLTGDTETFHSLVADQDSENHPWAVVEKAHMKEDVDKMLNTQLGSREREIIKMHYGVDSVDGYPMSLESISHRYGVSRERVRQLERAAKRKLQTTNQGLDKYCCMSI
ncbi:protein MpSIG1 [Marchantia polymorpha subsp. ruderalis]|uniref:RNA polymerase sigma-70 domain-containing protein n=2 Tax=Marchantia polymorpha TaxID=3197 RepID=A0A176VJI9_MARPO|nr:hypothetical protein AXG93_3873s1410 [Marchantia polymorpha subsp. ruderalis]PTQ47105.1 hypothetical protein MARPO_0009s0187 [Marchantia polymorpha]BBN17499.1 hypothetical protein Mp_7g15030 [Marchantia polymorpha subsp. ruderalis]|eukprot:PTQ47105.1 hypothetical protein MARPO_0009s0187 [Marchantia polymorpha]